MLACWHRLFTTLVTPSHVCLQLADPRLGCEPFKYSDKKTIWVVLIQRGECEYQLKVRCDTLPMGQTVLCIVMGADRVLRLGLTRTAPSRVLHGGLVVGPACPMCDVTVASSPFGSPQATSLNDANPSDCTCRGSGRVGGHHL